MKPTLIRENLEDYSENQLCQHYYIDGLPKNIECRFKAIYGYKYRDFNISPNDYYATLVDIENKSLFISLWYDNFDISHNRQECFEDVIKVISDYMIENFNDYNIFFYDVPDEVEMKLIEKYSEPIKIGIYKATIYLLHQSKI